MSKKRASSPENDERKKQKLSLSLSGVKAVIVEVGLGKTRASILAKQLEDMVVCITRTLKAPQHTCWLIRN